MVVGTNLLLKLNPAMNAQKLLGSHAKVGDWLLVLSAVAYWVLIDWRYSVGLLVILIPLAVQVLHFDYALSNE